MPSDNYGFKLDTNRRTESIRRLSRIAVTFIVGCAAVLSFGQGGLGPPGGSGGSSGSSGWTRTYEVKTKLILHTWEITGFPGSQTATPKDIDLSPAGISNETGATFGSMDMYYYPNMTMVEVPLEVGVDMAQEIRTTYKWTDTVNPAPTTLKLALSGFAYGSLNEGSSQSVEPPPIEGSIEVEDGLGHAATSGAEPNFYRKSDGTRYRMFNVEDGQIILKTKLKTSVKSMKGLYACLTFGCDPTDWFVKVWSEDDETFRRVARTDSVSGNPIAGKRVSNYYTDDGVTKWGNGEAYGDKVIAQSMIGPEYRLSFDTVLHSNALFPGASLDSHDLTSNATLTSYLPVYYKILAGYENLGSASNPPTADSLDSKTITALATASGGGLSDSATYKMRVHAPVKAEELLWTYNNSFMHRIHKVHQEITWDAAKWPPFLGARFVPGNKDEDYGYTKSSSFTSTEGYVKTIENSFDLTSGPAKMGYKSIYAVTQSFAATYGQTGTLGIKHVKVGEFIEFWEAYTGVAKLYYGSRWGSHGYEGDAKDLIAESVSYQPVSFVFPVGRGYSSVMPGDES